MTSSQTTAASTPSISDQPITGTSLDFFLFFNATYPDEDTQNTTGGSRTRKSRGMVMYRCLHYPADKPWTNRTRDNAWHHARRCHADIISSLDRTLIGGSSDVLDDEREVKRPRIDAFFPSRYSDGGYIEIKGKHIRGYPAWQLISSQTLLNHLILSLTSHRRGVECVGNWMREGIIVPRSHGGRGVISSVAVEFSVETEAEDFLD
ncbi:hypothetical protein RAB80_014319 [Fusarium oxysporum f. sp. vasinfectum]|nr:hypothetical protein RAB80_014702 [Fusarium oxysporum f. sp. vasinfectum]KAK2670182.1 hypothetical protein RAB80_014319 [Fusarium oxysporum f. sp. vasinfectum]